MITSAALALAAALAQAAAPAPEAAPPVAAAPPVLEADPAAGDAPGDDVTPAGSAADRELWRALRAATNGATLGMARVSQCSYRITYGKHYERLDALAKGGGEEERARARALRERLAAEAAAAGGAIPERPGVRECQYVLRDLGVYMGVASHRRARQELPALRRVAKGCVARLAPLAERLEARAAALEGALAAVDALPPVTVPAAEVAPAQGAPAAAAGAEGAKP